MSIEGDRNKAGMFSEGEILSATKLNELGALAGYGTTIHSDGASTIQGTSGTVFMDKVQVVQDQQYDYPFKVTIMPGASAGQWKVYVRAGTVNNMITKVLDGPYAGKYLDSTPRPYLEMNSATGDTKYVILRCTKEESSLFFPKKNEVYLADSLEAMADSEGEGHLLLASLSLKKTGVTISNITAVNQYIYSCQNLIRVKGGSLIVWNWTSR